MIKHLVIQRPFEADYYALPLKAEFEIYERIFGLDKSDVAIASLLKEHGIDR